MEKEDFNLDYYVRLKHRKLELESRINVVVDGEEKKTAIKLLKNVNQKLSDYEAKYPTEIFNLYTNIDNFNEFYKKMDEEYEKWEEKEKTSEKLDKVLLIILVCYGIFIILLFLFILGLSLHILMH